MHQLKDW